MEKNIQSDVFEKQSIPKAVCSLALPTMVGMLVMVIYNFVNAFFVGQLNDTNQVAAVTITIPIFLLLMAAGSTFGIGGGTYISRLLGRQKNEAAKQVSSFSFYGSLALGFVCAAFGLAFMSPILNLSGASVYTYEFAKSYLTIIAIGSPVIILSFSMGQIVHAEGAAKQAMVGMMIGTIVNIVLDPMLILWAGMGVAGAAVATVFANTVSVIYYIYYFTTKNSQLSISIRKLTLNKVMVKEILYIGIPASLNSILMSTANIILNNFAASYGDNVVAALGIVNRITLLPVMLLLGLCQGVQPLIGYSYAANNRKRMNGVLKVTAIYGTAIGVIFTALFYFLRESIVQIFIADLTVVALGVSFLKVIIIAIPFLGIQFLLTNTFQAMGKGLPSLFLSISRQGLLFIPFLIIANKLVGLQGLVYAQPIVDIVITGLATVLYGVVKRKKTRPTIKGNQ